MTYDLWTMNYKQLLTFSFYLLSTPLRNPSTIDLYIKK
jgi:hypothetical protein